MESGLEGRNNQAHQDCRVVRHGVSMESGLEGRNNHRNLRQGWLQLSRLNGVRPRRPEQ